MVNAIELEHHWCLRFAILNLHLFRGGYRPPFRSLARKVFCPLGRNVYRGYAFKLISSVRSGMYVAL